MNLEALFINWLGLKDKDVAVCANCKTSIVVGKTNHNPYSICNRVDCWKALFLQKLKGAIENEEKEIKTK